MVPVFKLYNTVKHYDWGSPLWIPRLLGEENPSGGPWAELWMGLHPEGPSQIILDDKKIPLSRLLEDNPAYLGAAAAAFGTLPFLFKLLAAESPLSIQAHPNREQAKQGWDRENRLGIPLKDPRRNYKDANHKPEILCALSPFKAMCGFRETGGISRRLAAFIAPAPPSLRGALAPLGSALDLPGGLKAFLTALFGLSEGARRELSEYAARQAWGEEFGEERRLIARFAGLYPGDPAILAPLYLNLVDLAPGEAVCLPAGVLHAYIHGFGAELMANSDNVLRGGLTAKHADIPELVHILRFSPFLPEILRPPPGGSFFRYPSPGGEFSLSVLSGGAIPFPDAGPSIVAVTEGRAFFSGADTGGKPFTLGQGESAFIPARASPEGLFLSGAYTLYAAGIPPP
jgi:mannose-6-phosphate isomerase